MPSRRDQIKMSADELAQFLDEEKTLTCATVGTDGRPHLMPLWFVRDGTELRGWTFAKSQKTKNLEREPLATIQVEAGLEYQDLRGVMMECDVVVAREVEAVADHGMELFERYSGTSELPPETRDMVLAQAPKRVGLRFIPTRVVSWDHRKLGGVY